MRGSGVSGGKITAPFLQKAQRQAVHTQTGCCREQEDNLHRPRETQEHPRHSKGGAIHTILMNYRFCPGCVWKSVSY